MELGGAEGCKRRLILSEVPRRHVTGAASEGKRRGQQGAF